MYADDTTVYVKSNNLLDCSNLMNSGLDSTGRWLSDSCLTLNDVDDSVLFLVESRGASMIRIVL